MLKTKAITPAMRAWCEALAKPEVCRWVRRGAVLTMYGSSQKRTVRASIVGRMEEAGLIEWDQLDGEATARLTPAGQRASYRSPTVGRTINFPSPIKRKRKSKYQSRFAVSDLPPDEVARLNAIMLRFRTVQRELAEQREPA